MIGRYMSSESGLGSGGTISGDLTIDGDLTVNGDGGFAYSEVLTGDMAITNTADTIGLTITQSGDGSALLIDQNHATALGLYVDAETTTGTAVEINTNVLTTGIGTLFTSNSSNTGAFEIVRMHNNHASATGATVLKIQQDSTGYALNAVSASDADVTVANFQSAIDANGEHSIIRVGHSSKAAYMGLLLNSADTAYFGIDDNPDDGNGIYVNESGNIGIGTKVPASDSRLHLYSATHGTDLIQKFQAENDSGTVIPFYMRLDPDADTFAFFGDVDNSLVINAGTGNVGIGSSVPNEGNLVVQDGTKAELVIKTSATATDTEAALMFKISTDTVDQRKKGGIIYKDVGDNGVGDMFFVLDSATDNGSATVADNTAMVIKNSGNVLIGLSTADTPLDITPRLQVEGLNASTSSISLFRNSNDAHPSYLLLGKSRGTAVNADTVIQDNDVLGKIAFVGADGTDRHNSGAEIFARINGTPGGNDLPTELVFGTTADGGTSPTERMTINSSGNIGINQASPDSQLHIVNPDGGTYRFGYGGSSDVYVDADNFYWRTDNGGANQMTLTTSGLGIGVTAPEAQLNIAKAGSSDNAIFYIDTFSSGINNQSIIGLRKSNSNSVGTETTVEDDEKLGKIAWYGGETDGYDEAASIHAEVDGTPGSNDTDMPGALVFGTTADGTGSSAERMRITSTGNVNIGSVTSAIQATGLHVATGAAGAIGNITIESSSNATSPPTLHFAKARGSAGSRSAINTAGGDILGSLSFTGFDGAHDRAGAEINATSVATSSQGTDMPADLIFKTSADGTSSPTERMRIASSGNATFAGDVTVERSSVDTTFKVSRSDQTNIQLISAGQSYVRASAALSLQSNGANTALTLDTSQNATFAGTVQANTGSKITSASADTTFSIETTSGTTIFPILDLVSSHSSVGGKIRQGGSDVISFDKSQNATFAGALSKSSGSFKIDHPLTSKKDTHYLVHSFVEAPQADNIYRGKATLSNGTIEINLDTSSGMSEGTFVLLNTDIQCFTSNESDWDAVKGSVNGNILTISCQNTNSTANVSWLVIGERQDQHMIDVNWTDENGKVIVEPEKIIN